MSEDKREAILVRLVEVMKGLVGESNVFRNQIDIPEGTLPVIVIFDADETPDPDSYGRGRPAHGPVRVSMTPEIHMLLNGDSETIGSDINALRARVIKAAVTDASLVALCQNGDIRYEGFATGLAAGRSMQGEAGIVIGFNYILRPDRL